MDAKIAGFYTCYDAYFCKIFTYLCKSSLERRFMKKIMNEKLTITTSNPVRARFYEYPRFTYPWHFHSEYEIIYVEKGEGDCLVGDSIISYSKGDLILFGSELPHSMQSPPDGGEESDNEEKSELKVRGVNIQFEKDFMHHAFNYYPHFIKIKNLLEEAQRGIYFPAGCSSRLVELLESIPLETGVDQITSFLQLLKEMANVTSRSVISTSDFENDIIYDGSRIDKIIAYLNKNYTRQIDLNEISSLAAMNPAAFCRFFKSKTGKSFKNYILEMRIGYACKLLLMGDMNISQISVECGFDTISHFNKSFKKHTGFSPSYYKKMMLAE